jgi:cytoskeleton protein RodZ
MNDFGGKLRLARERRGISLRQIATTTKIALGALEALERNDVSRLPGGIFTRSFVRSYATEVGLDPDATVQEFLERFQHVPAPSISAPAPVSEADSTFDARQRLAGVVLKAVLIAVPLLVLILYFTMRVRTPAAVSSAPRAVPSAPAAARPEPQTPPAVAQSPTPVATSGASRASIVDGLVLDVATSDKCWVKITTDGKVTVARLMQAGDKERLELHDKAVIQVGNAGAFTFAINGRPAKSLGPPGSIRTAVITKDTLARYLQ